MLVQKSKIFSILSKLIFIIKNNVYFIISLLFPYNYINKKYSQEFMKKKQKSSPPKIIHTKINKIIYMFWTGTNEITPNRMQGIDSLKKNAEIPVRIITPKNLCKYILPDDPLPSAYEKLSLNHRSDYLRAYFMYHYGGGYADIKRYAHSWKEAFNELDDSDAYVLGYPEVNYCGAANIKEDKILAKDLEIYWRLLIGNGAFICRPHTPFTEEWYSETKRRLLLYSDQLSKHPAKGIFGENKDYPLPWTYLQGEVFHPLCLKYNNKILRNKKIKPSFVNYR